MIASASPERILAESDIHDITHCTELTWEMVCTIASVRDWPIEEEWIEDLEKEKWGVVRRVRENWITFSRTNRVP